MFVTLGSPWAVAYANGSTVNPVRSASPSVAFSILSIVVQILSGTSSSGNFAIFTSLTKMIDYTIFSQGIALELTWNHSIHVVVTF